MDIDRFVRYRQSVPARDAMEFLNDTGYLLCRGYGRFKVAADLRAVNLGDDYQFRFVDDNSITSESFQHVLRAPVLRFDGE